MLWQATDVGGKVSSPLETRRNCFGRDVGRGSDSERCFYLCLNLGDGVPVVLVIALVWMPLCGGNAVFITEV